MESKIIYAFSNPVRLKLLCCLDKKSSNVNELITSCGIAQSAVSQHLTKLKRAGLVKSKRRGKFIYYSLINQKTGKLANDFNKYLKEVN
jgi:DNA-binding transcriptional ArsR family regulator